MAAQRQDSWLEEEDLLLAEVTLRHIREGSTQLAAFEEVAKKINRTPAACGFRWNAELRKKYEKAIEIAKAQRKQRLSSRTRPASEGMREGLAPALSAEKGQLQAALTGEQLEIRQVIAFLEKLEQHLRQLESENRELKAQIQKLKEEQAQLQEEVEREKSRRVKLLESDEDYLTLLEILHRAKQMAKEDEVAQEGQEEKQETIESSTQ